jgi:hypothetical protein
MKTLRALAAWLALFGLGFASVHVAADDLLLLGVGTALAPAGGGGVCSGGSYIEQEANSDSFQLEASTDCILEETSDTDTKISAYSDGGPLQPGDFIGIARAGANNRLDGEDLVAVHDREPSLITITDSTTETTICTYSVPANELGSTRAMRLVLYGTVLNTTGTPQSFTLRIKFGGTTIYQDLVNVNANTTVTGPIFMVINLGGNNATNAQSLSGRLHTGFGTNTTTGFGDMDIDEIEGSTPFFNTAAIDQTSAQTLEATMQLSNGGGTEEFVRRYCMLERV